MKNYNNNDNKNDNTINNINNHIKNHNNNARPNKKTKKRKNLPKKDSEHSYTKNNGFINEINPNPNDNYGPLKNININDNIDDNEVSKIIGGNDNNCTNQLNEHNIINDYNYSNRKIPPLFESRFREYLHKEIYRDINICNSIIVILNYNQDIKMYLYKSQRKNQISFLEYTFGCSLASILYQSHQYL